MRAGLVAAATERFGRLDVLVANAGVIPLGDVQEMTTADWDDVMAIDGRGMFLTCKFGIEAMSATFGGSIVCLSSISGVAGQKRQAAYGPAMHLAVEWADRGIRVNAVAFLASDDGPSSPAPCCPSTGATWRSSVHDEIRLTE